MSAQSQRCDLCAEELLVDWSKSDLVAVPQVLVAACPKCKAEYSRTAPLTDGGDGHFWIVADSVCRICGAQERSVFSIGTDQSALECGACGNMTSEVLEDGPEEEEPPFGFFAP